MDELSSACQKKLETFRIAELKDVLTRICAGKNGRKQVLLERIMKIILPPEKQQFGPKGLRNVSSSTYAMSREEIAQVIDDIYRKMWGSSALDLVTQDDSNVTPRTIINLSKVEDSEEKIQCHCGCNVKSDSMKQCDDPKCMVWQHVACVCFLENGELEREPQRFFCELCRIQHGDPYAAAVSHPLLPTKMVTSIHGSEKSKGLQNADKSFMLTRSDLDLLQQQQYDLQVWSILLNDKVTFRMHWPLHTELGLNGCLVRATSRPGHQDLGINGRDDGVSITKYVREGRNYLFMSTSDVRPFCIGVRMIQFLTLEQVLKHVPSEDEGEPFHMSLARVRRSIIGGDEVDDSNGDDSDLEIMSECISVNLRCPVSGSRMKVAGRFKPCVHMGCFDLHTFVEINRRTRKWQCPICLTNYSLDELIIDPFMNRIVNAMKTYGEDVIEIEMKPDGCWRPKNGGDASMKEQWRLPDGSYSLKRIYEDHRDREESIETSTSKDVQPVRNSCPLKIGIKRMRDGKWKLKQTEVCKYPSSTPKVANYGSDLLMSGNGVSSNLEEKENCPEKEGIFQTFHATEDIEVNSSGPKCFTIEDSEPEVDDTDVIILNDSDEEDISVEKENSSGLQMLQSVAQAEEERCNEKDISVTEVEPSHATTIEVFSESNQNGSKIPANTLPFEGNDIPFEGMIICAGCSNTGSENLTSGKESSSEVEVLSPENERRSTGRGMLSEHTEAMEERRISTVIHDVQSDSTSTNSGNDETISKDHSRITSVPCPIVERHDGSNVFQCLARLFPYSFLRI